MFDGLNTTIASRELITRGVPKDRLNTVLSHITGDITVRDLFERADSSEDLMRRVSDVLKQLRAGAVL